jgi:hypothetical protein
VIDLIRKDKVQVLVEEYDTKQLVPLLVVVIKFLGHMPTSPQDPLVFYDSLFNEPTSMKLLEI